MSPRLRVGLMVALAAAAAAAITVVATVLTRTEPLEPVAASRAGAPPLVLDLGVRTDPEARDLRRAAGLYARKRYRQAQRISERHRSVEAQVAAALSAWPEEFDRLGEIARDRETSGAAQLAFGLALLWQGRVEEARRYWRLAKQVEPDSQYAIRAGDFLHPELPVPGLPVFIPSFPPPEELSALDPPAQYGLLRRRAAGGGVRDHLLYGVALQRLGRPVSARRELDRAALLAPRDPDALVATAVARFDKDQPSQAFSRLGPLARRFPRAATVRFHLGLLLVWLGRVEDARLQFRRARAIDPGSIPAQQAAEFLRRLPAQRP